MISSSSYSELILSSTNCHSCMKETDSINYLIAYSVFSLFNKVAIVVRSVADFVRKNSAETSHCLTARDFYVVIV